MNKPKEKAPGIGEVTTAQLLDRIKALESSADTMNAKLSESEQKRLAAETALAQVEVETETTLAQIMSRTVHERSLGKRTVPMKTYDHRKKVYVDGETTVEFFEYLIDLPPIGGEGIRLGGNLFEHNTIVEVDANTLRSIKEQVYRQWAHEVLVKGGNENAMWGRKSMGAVFSMKKGGRVA